MLRDLPFPSLQHHLRLYVVQNRPKKNIGFVLLNKCFLLNIAEIKRKSRFLLNALDDYKRVCPLNVKFTWRQEEKK